MWIVLNTELKLLDFNLMVYDTVSMYQIKLKRLCMGKLVTKIQISNLFSAIAEHREDDMVSMLTENISLINLCMQTSSPFPQKCKILRFYLTLRQEIEINHRLRQNYL